jgi:hypothetical protein
VYPGNYFALFPPFPRENKVFVAMSFDPRFDARWERVLKPAIRSVSIGGNALQEHRVDIRRISDSILTEILSAVTNDTLILADITSIGQNEKGAIRNGNVMYEIGLSHTKRLPEEVLLFRSDKDYLLFDMANVRVNEYDPDGQPEKAKKQVINAIIEAMKEIDLKKHRQ